MDRSGASRSAVAKPTKKRGSPSELLQQIKTLIETDRLLPGMRLPPERVLADQLRVGRPAIREAIKALQMLDVVESRQGDGTYVKSLAGLSVGWPTRVILGPATFDLMELWEVRKMFEPQAAGLAAARASQRQLREMEQKLFAQEAHCKNYHLFAKDDYQFHDAIIRAAGNHILGDVIRLLAPLLLKSRHITVRTTPDLVKIIGQHRSICEAIRLGNAELAERAMREHLQIAGLDLISETRR